MQRHKKWLIVTIWISVIALVSAGMVGWNPSSFSLSGDQVAKVGKIKISQQEFINAYQRVFNEYNQMLGGNLDQLEAKKFGLDKRALNQLVQRAQLQSLAKDLGLRLEDSEVVDTITKDSNFQRDGRFDDELYRQLLRDNHLSVKFFEESVRDSLLVDKLIKLLPISISSLETWSMGSTIALSDTITYQILKPEAPKTTITQAMLKDHWEKHKSNYMQKPSIELASISIPISTQKFNNEDLLSLYNEDKTLYLDDQGQLKSFDEVKTKVQHDFQAQQAKKEAMRLSNQLRDNSKDAKNLLHYWGVYDAFCNKLPLRRVYDANELWSCLEYVSPETFSRVIDNMNSAIRKLEAKDNAQREKYAIEELLNVDDNLSLHILDTSYQSSFYKNLICSQFMAEYKSVMEENGVEEPLAQAYNGGMILRNMLGDKWDSNPASAYVGALLNHFQENSAFDLFAIENDVLSSFAAFCQKGDNIDRLVEYLVQVGFCNYKLAYGIYGATRGFTSLPKTFTSILINGNKDYYQSFASNVWRMLNGVEIKDAVLPKTSTNASVIVESQLGSKIIENINNVESKVVKVVNRNVEFENAVQSPKIFMYILSSFSRITTTKAYKALASVNFEVDEGSYTPEQFRRKIYSIVGKEGLKTQKENIDKAIELDGKKQDPEAFLSILDSFLKPTDAAYKKIVQLISGIESFNTISRSKTQGNKAISQGVIEKQNPKPINPTSSKFVEDTNVDCFILSRKYLPEKMRVRLSKKVKTFQKGYAPGGKYYSNPSDNPVDNKSTIDHFKHWCFYDKGDYPPIVEGTYENKQYFEKLTQDLLNRYANR